jgi:hypothetical protein
VAVPLALVPAPIDEAVLLVDPVVPQPLSALEPAVVEDVPVPLWPIVWPIEVLLPVVFDMLLPGLFMSAFDVPLVCARAGAAIIIAAPSIRDFNIVSLLGFCSTAAS